MKLFALAAVAALTSVQAQAYVCTSVPNQFGGTTSVTVDKDEAGQPTVTLFAQGGRAHFVSKIGPLVATAQHEPDGTIYSLTDSFGQKIVVSVFTTSFGGKVQTTATTDFGLWKNSVMYCK